MGLINFDKRTKFGRENAETFAILKFFYWIAKVLFWPVKFVIKLCINLAKLIWKKRLLVFHIFTFGVFIWGSLIWKKRLLVSHICTLGIFIWLPKLFRKYKESTKNQISDGNIKTRSER